MTMLMPASPRERAPIRIFRDTGRQRAVAFQPGWEPLFCPDTGSPGMDRLGTTSRLSPRHFDLVRSVVLSVCVSAIVTLVLTLRAVGLAPDWGQTWLATLKLSLLLGLPARFLIEPYVARLVALFLAPPHR
jgi:hypothetical protein